MQISKEVPGVPLTIEREGHTHGFCCTQVGSVWVADHVVSLIKNQFWVKTNEVRLILGTSVDSGCNNTYAHHVCSWRSTETRVEMKKVLKQRREHQKWKWFRTSKVEMIHTCLMRDDKLDIKLQNLGQGQKPCHYKPIYPACMHLSMFCALTNLRAPMKEYCSL